MKELTFREVIANIKEGEVWENTKKCFVLEAIKKEDGIIKLDFRDKRTSFGIDGLFKLKINKVSFSQAFKAYEEGKEIVSCVSGYKYYYDGLNYYIQAPEGTSRIKWLERTFRVEEIRGKWYIN